MITGDSEETRLLEARKLFEEATDFWSSWLREAEEDLKFYHGDQWSYEDVQILQEQKRPVLTYNVLQAKVGHMLGAQEDNAVDPIAVPTGAEDQFLADAVNHIKMQVYDENEVERVDPQIFEDGIVAGIGNAFVDPYPDPKDPTRLRFIYDRAHPLEVLWDPACERRDKTDARYLCWAKWLSKGEFLQEFPDMTRREVDELFAMYAGGEESWSRWFSTDTTGSATQAAPNFDGYMPRRSQLYYDAKRREMRVIHIECIKPVKRVRVSSGGMSRITTPKMRRALEENYPGAYYFEEYWDEEVWWYEFCHGKMLYESRSPQPFDGFSVKSFVYKSDDDNRPYGIVRLLKDPQREVNKRYSQILHWIMSQSAPGLLGEQDAFVDLQQAKESLKRAGDVTLLKKGAISQQKVKERQIPVMPEAVARLQEIALRMIDLISNVHVDDMVEPRGIPEAAATTQLKHRRSLLSMKPVLREYHYFRRDVFLAFLQSIVRAMPDQQIADYMGNAERFRVQGREIIDLQSNQVASISTLREVRLNARFEPNANNQTERLLELNTLMALQQGGTPVAPDVIFDMMSLNQAKRDRLKAFAQQTIARQAQSEKQQADSMMQQMQQQYQLEAMDRQIKAGELAEETRSAQATEFITSMDNTWAFMTRLMDLWIKADDNEKSRVTDLMTELIRSADKRATARQQGAANG